MTLQAERAAPELRPDGPIFLPENRQEQLIQQFLSLKGNPAVLLSEMAEQAASLDSLYDHLKFCLLQSRGGVARIHEDAEEEVLIANVQLRMEFFEAIVAAQERAASKRRALGDMAIISSL